MSLKIVDWENMVMQVLQIADNCWIDCPRAGRQWGVPPCRSRRSGPEVGAGRFDVELSRWWIRHLDCSPGTWDYGDFVVAEVSGTFEQPFVESPMGRGTWDSGDLSSVAEGASKWVVARNCIAPERDTFDWWMNVDSGTNLIEGNVTAIPGPQSLAHIQGLNGVGGMKDISEFTNEHITKCSNLSIPAKNKTNKSFVPFLLKPLIWTSPSTHMTLCRWRVIFRRFQLRGEYL